MALDMEALSALVSPPDTIGFPAQGPVVQSFDVFFDVNLNNQLNKQSSCL